MSVKGKAEPMLKKQTRREQRIFRSEEAAVDDDDQRLTWDFSYV